MTLTKCLKSLSWLHHGFQRRFLDKNLQLRCLSCYSVNQKVPFYDKSKNRITSKSSGGTVLQTWADSKYILRLSSFRLHTKASARETEKDEILAEIQDVKNADELLKVLEGFGIDHLAPDHIVAALERLATTFYDDMAIHPWFQSRNHSIAYIQMLMNKKLQKFSEELRNHDVFKLLLKLVDGCVEELNGLQHSNIHLSLTRLGLEPENDLSVKLLVRAPDLCESASFETLVNFTTMQLSQNRRNPILIHRVLEKVRKDLDSFDLSSVDSLMGMSQLLLSVSYLMSETLCKRLLDKVMVILDNNPDVLHDPNRLGAMLRLGRRVITRFPPDKVNYQVQIYNQCEEALRNWEDFSRFEDNHIAEICSNLQFAMRFRREFADKFCERGLELINDPKISVVSNLCYAFDSSVSLKDRRVVETALFKTIDDADLLIVSNLAESLRLMNCTNDDLLEKFQEKIIDNLDGIFEYVTRFEKIIRCLLWRNFINPENERIFVKSLLHGLAGGAGSFQLGTRLWCIGLAATYLLQNTRYVIPEILYKKLVDIIPQCSIKDLYPVMIAMNSFKKPMAASTQNQIYHLQTMTYTSIIERLDAIVSINLLTSMLRDLVAKSKAPDANLIEKLMHLYIKFSDPKLATEEKFHRIISIHLRLNYYNPLVFDNLTEFAITNVNNMEMRKLLRLYFLLTKVGYVPKNMDSLVEATMEKYEKEKDTIKVADRIQLFRGLADLQIFPKQQIQDLFSLDFIQLVDKHIAENPSNKKFIEWNMMNLNRAIVLECPELDVPWFHEQYCKDTMTLSDEIRSVFMEQVSVLLTEIFGGWRFVRKWVFTPYFHTINFEVVLDKEGKPINLAQIESVPENAQRLAIRTLFYSQYCYHRRELNGFEKAKMRHLQLLGYKVVEISLHDWNSMSLSDKESKIEYIKEKISS